MKENAEPYGGVHDRDDFERRLYGNGDENDAYLFDRWFREGRSPPGQGRRRAAHRGHGEDEFLCEEELRRAEGRRGYGRDDFHGGHGVGMEDLFGGYGDETDYGMDDHYGACGMDDIYGGYGGAGGIAYDMDDFYGGFGGLGHGVDDFYGGRGVVNNYYGGYGGGWIGYGMNDLYGGYDRGMGHGMYDYY
ncbi:hypothetical protein LTR78_006510 [Recurvomyces mirabilis]|uniref:Uncharacterized protein n=1 Tax=Recurvomyces mirabilis TaxID=574656 RepID=A0AAE0WKY1_9PEZI|nr:hypothetical protein LTR78_006510 [Recurvomyces mirabilis]KAK5151072.1 hypothetical protein LTS14_009567 [Recurvomyces mirabilis]